MLTTRGLRAALLGSVAGFAALTAVPVFAQDDEAVLVTGSRIPRANLTAPTSVTTIDSEALEASGLSNAADILRTVPSFGVSGISTNNSNFATAGAGINTLQLRNLGEDRTLVLVNGRRWVSGVSGTSNVDFNTIPVNLIQRVEVITGGASAVYGSDALAGVINVILKDDFEGIEFSAQTGRTEYGDDISHRADLLLGGNFSDGRGNVVLSGTFSQENGVLSRNRPETEVDDIATCAFSGDPADCKTPIEPFFSSFSEFGRFFDYSTGESFTIDTGVGPTGTVVPFSTASFGFNRQALRRYSVPTERILLTGFGSYEITDSIEAFFETTFANTKTESEIEPFPHSNSDVNLLGIPITNPFVPAALIPLVADEGDTVIPYFRRMTELGQRGARAHRNTYRFATGFRGDVFESYEWEAFFSFGQTEDDQQGGGQLNAANMREALNAIDGDGDPLTFDPVCANPAAVAEGCVPINLFGFGSITPEAAAYVRAPSQRQQAVRQEVLGATIGGPVPVVSLPAGDIDFAAGLEWRRESSEDVPDALTQSGGNAGNKEGVTAGSYHVFEAFIEAEAPILKDLPFAHDLTIGGAFRFSDYSTVGKTEAYTGRVSWAPIEPLRFRAQYARAVRAANIGELFAPGGENFAPVSDPCEGTTLVDDAATTIDDNCRAIPEVLARIVDQGIFTLTQTEVQGTGGFTGKGNAGLQPEISDSYSFGAVVTHGFDKLGDFTLSVDWFQIEIEKYITTVGRQQALDLCFDVPTAAFPNAFCGSIVRDTTGPDFQLGEITEVNSGFINEGTFETRGVDVSLLWTWDLQDWFLQVPGDMSLRVNYANLQDLTETLFGTEDSQEGLVGASKHEWQGAITYANGPISFQWETVYVGDATPSFTNPAFNYKVGEHVTHDVQFGYDVTQNLNLYLGVDNVFDNDAPTILSGVPGNVTGTDTDANVYDPIGRVGYIGLRVAF